MPICKNCDMEFKYSRNTHNLYCSNKCQQDFQTANKIARWKAGKEKGWSGTTKKISAFIRNYLFQKFSNKCVKCGWGEIHPITKKVPLEVNHIDGNAENCIEINLELLCPNCHSLTPNFRNLNKDKSSRIR